MSRFFFDGSVWSILRRTLLILLPFILYSEGRALEMGKAPREQKSTTWFAQVVRDANLEKRIPGLNFLEQQIPVTLVKRDKRLQPFVELKGTYMRPGWSLFVQGGGGRTQLTDYQDRKFSVFAYLHARLSRFSFVSVGPNGETEVEHVDLDAPEAQEFRIGKSWGEVLPSVGLATLSYDQTGFPDFSSKAAILGLKYSTPSWGSSRWGLEGDSKLSVWTLHSSATGKAPGIFSLRGSLSYLAREQWNERWGLKLFLGSHYVTWISNGAAFGFSNLIIADLGFRLKYEKNRESFFFGEIHYSPISGIYDSSNLGYDLMLGWSRRAESLSRLEVRLGFSEITYVPVTAVKVETRALSLLVGYSL